MITREEVMPLLINACPSFSGKWEIYKQEWYDEGEEFLLYCDSGEFARHLIELFRQSSTKEFEKVFEVIEKLHVEGDDYVKEAATIGFLESIQNIAGNNDLDPEVFYKFLKPESSKWWHELNKFWNAEIKYVGETIND